MRRSGTDPRLAFGVLADLVFRLEGRMSATKIPLALWARTQRVLLEMYQAETWTAHDADPDRYPAARSDADWSSDFAAWKARLLP